MQIQALYLKYLIDALVNIGEASPGQFTLTAPLMIQILPSSFWFLFAPNNVAVDWEQVPELTEAREQGAAIIETLQACLEPLDSNDTAGRRACLETASEALLTLFEEQLLAVLLPEDWQVTWMGVEG